MVCAALFHCIERMCAHERFPASEVRLISLIQQSHVVSAYWASSKWGNGAGDTVAPSIEAVDKNVASLELFWTSNLCGGLVAPVCTKSGNATQMHLNSGCAAIYDTVVVVWCLGNSLCVTGAEHEVVMPTGLLRDCRLQSAFSSWSTIHPASSKETLPLSVATARACKAAACICSAACAICDQDAPFAVTCTPCSHRAVHNSASP